MKTLLFVPCYNCESQIVSVLKDLEGSGVSAYLSHVAIVDNCSSDNTVAAARMAIEGLSDERLKSIIYIGKNEKNLGLGGSFKRSSLWAKKRGFSHFAVFHGDHQASARDLVAILKKIEHHSGNVLGARFDLQARLKNYSFRRNLANRFFNFLTSRFTGVSVTDIGSGLNVYRLDDLPHDLLEGLPAHIAFDLHILLDLIQSKKSILFHPISWRSADEVSTVSNFKVGFLVLGILFRWRFYA